MGMASKIRDDLNAARKERADRERILLLSTLAGEVERVGKDSGSRETTDAEALAVIRKFIKNAEQTAADLGKAGRDAGHIQREIGILEAYLPAAVAEQEVESAVREILAGMAGGNPKAAMGLAIKALKERFGDRFDGNAMVPAVKRALGD